MDIKQQCIIVKGHFKKGESKNYKTAADKCSWLQVISGEIRVNQVELNEGDGLGITHEDQLEIVSKTNSDLIFVEMNIKLTKLV